MSIALEVDAWVGYEYSEHFSTLFGIAYIDIGDYVDDLLDAMNFANYRFDAVTGNFTGINDGDELGEDEAWRAYANFFARW